MTRDPSSASSGSFAEELRKRGVLRTALLYGAGAFAVLEFADIAFPRLGLPDAAVSVVLWAGIAGFPLALLASWFFEARPEGSSGVRKHWLSPATVAMAAALLVLGVAVGLLWGDATPPPAARDRPVSPQAERSIAVLPFANMSQDTSNEAFTVGIHDDLLTQISRIGSIKTISRTSVLQYRKTTKTVPEIARELGVATVLQGAVQRSGDRVRINVQLIDAESDDHLWASTYDRELSAVNVFAIQTEVATSVADALRATLTSSEKQRLEKVPTESLAAVESYFHGKQLLERRNGDSLLAAVRYFKEVIELDPDFALAHSGLADAYMLLPEYIPSTDPVESRRAAEAASSRALELDPDLPEALGSKGWSLLVHRYDWAGAEDSLRRALDVDPNNTNALHWLSHVLSWQGKQDEATRLARRAQELDPNSRVMWRNLSYILMDARNYDECLSVGEATLERFEDADELYQQLWLALLRAGRPEEGGAYLVTWAERTGRDVEAARALANASVRYQRTGVLQELSPEVIERVDLGKEHLGQAYAFLGDAENALAALEAAFESASGSRSVLSMGVNPGYDFLREHPRFVALLKRVGLAPERG